HDAYKALPPIGPNLYPSLNKFDQNAQNVITKAAPGYCNYSGATLMGFLLPYTEQNAIWTQYVNNGSNNVGVLETSVVSLFICPSEVYSTGQGGYGWSANIALTFGDYAGNYYVFGNPGGAVIGPSNGGYYTTD